MMIRIKRITVSLLLVVLILCSMIMYCMVLNKAEAYQLWGYDLVDSGKHLDWDGSTKYQDIWSKSTAKWNKVNAVIRPDAWNITQDVEISDYYSATGDILAYTSYTEKTIKFNDYYFAKMSNDERQKTMMHEIGHALGLNENNTVVGSIMKQGKRAQTELHLDDIEGFEWMYNYGY